MSYSDEVRAYCMTAYIEPARTSGRRGITIRAGDVHEAMNFQNRFPLVCSAIGARIFEEQGRVRRLGVEGPLNGANTVFRFEVLA